MGEARSDTMLPSILVFFTCRQVLRGDYRTIGHIHRADRVRTQRAPPGELRGARPDLDSNRRPEVDGQCTVRQGRGGAKRQCAGAEVGLPC